jgi:hypothetical protein
VTDPYAQEIATLEYRTRDRCYGPNGECEHCRTLRLLRLAQQSHQRIERALATNPDYHMAKILRGEA